MNDLLNDPELRRVFSLLESEVTPLGFEDLTANRTTVTRRVPSFKLVLAAMLVVVFIYPAVGAVVARRVQADSPAVGEHPVALTISSREVDSPSFPPALNLWESPNGILASSEIAADTSGYWFLGEDLSWVELPNFDGDAQLLGVTQLGGQLVGTAISYNETTSWGGIYAVDPMDQVWSVLVETGDTVLPHLESYGDGFLAIGTGADSGQPTGPVGWFVTDNGAQPGTFSGPDGTSVSAVSTFDGIAIATGGNKFRLPMFESVKPVIWRTENGTAWEAIDLPSLRPFGFGYWIGGFRMADGFEFAAAGEAGFIASSGGLQLWEGFHDGINLDPGEAWSTLVVTSPDGQEWTPHLLGGLALWQIVPFDGGWLGLGMLKPESNTEVIVIDGQEILVAVSPPSTLYYSADGAQWENVIGSPSLERPAMALVGPDQVVVVDQADREGPVQIHRIEKQRP